MTIDYLTGDYKMLERLEAVIEEETLLEAASILMATDILMEVEIDKAFEWAHEMAGEDDYLEHLEEAMEECSIEIEKLRDEAIADIKKTAHKRDIMLASAIIASA